MLDFRMGTFLTVCQCMNFTRASEALNITQPAVSQHIRYLEKHYNTKLFRYEGKRLKITSAGQMLRDASLAMSHDEMTLQNEIGHLDKENKDIRFGATKTVGEVVMADIIKHYMETEPEIQLHMEVANTQELLDRLDCGEIDFALVEGFFRKSEYEFLKYSTEPYIAVCSSDYKFEKNPARIEDLFGERILLRENGSGTRAVLERYLDSQNFTVGDFRRCAEIGSLHTIKELTKAGCGITFLYEVAVCDELEKGVLKQIPLKNCSITHDFTFIWRRGSIYTEMYRNLFEQFYKKGKKA